MSNDNTGLAQRQQTDLAVADESPSQWRMMMQQAEAFVKSGFLPSTIRTPQAALAIMMTGRELGIGPMTALRTIHVIEQKPTLSATLMAALIQKAHGDDALQQIESTATVARYRFKRRGWEKSSEYAYTIEMATRAGLVGKTNWKNHPEAMLRARCISAIASANFQDVTLGLYTPEEMGADVVVTDTGDIRYEPGAPTVTDVTAQSQPPKVVGPRQAELNRMYAHFAEFNIPEADAKELFALVHTSGQKLKDVAVEEVKRLVDATIAKYPNYDSAMAALEEDTEEGEFTEPAA